ncbi:DNA-binding MarR family transcriptional regulator [Nocardioides luteus]|uniref:Transcriptional regulator n=1 Tax=Nocardioides luteus TaxID=1844 RepID=A0ABQ5SSE4_9ACTN|nr:MarR family transcriptional regulator [Nocardioides luteus]MDR7311178.1 DNA-binding MarR family transcriptional regulator [Nocardioides luteus]GGR62826.1 transcriptional regulator [Nocardioides luteus]GLJ66724.1 transcriptional regulator [Nocardioides luteus]
MTAPPRRDAVARVLAQWREVAPDVDLSPIEIIGRINRISTLLSATDQHLAETGLTRAEFDLLGALRRTGRELTPSELARETFSSGAAVTKRLKVLHSRDLIERRVDDRDHRISRISLTSAGERLHAAYLPVQLDADRELLSDLSPGDGERLAELLSVLLTQLDGRAGPSR